MEKVTGRIHSFESFSTVDGPGVRYVIFLQGCPLRCKYCHNRDTRDVHLGEVYDTEAIVEKILNYREYMGEDGGVTVSGGEPLLQIDFVIDLFKRLKAEGIHTAIDTSGFVDVDKLKDLLDYTDLVILDLKEMDNDTHKDLIGADNAKILKFAEHISNEGVPMWIRHVLVPTITDKEEHLIKLKEFVSTLKTVEKVEVLGYHTLGSEKWEMIGDKFMLEGIAEASADDVKRAEQILGIE
ncbi:MAG: pyruvate formate lyase-activating protein [Clostridia bacterium]|nr:pyruvate formate lyase-activating protein [Clostridia bacterium]